MLLDENRAEHVKYSYPNYDAFIVSFFCACPEMSRCGRVLHWHNDVEFLVTIRGTAEHNVNGEIFTLHPGETIFVNSRQMHYVCPTGEDPSEILCVRLNPDMLCMSPFFDSNYVLPVTQNRNMPFLILREEGGWQQEIIHSLNEMYRQKKNTAAHLKIHGLFCYIWSMLCENMPEYTSGSHSGDTDLIAIEEMLKFIEQHYTEKLTLSQIAASGHVCESKCCRLFNRYVHKTPNTYLSQYRLGRAAELLVSTGDSITGIAFACGFSGASYFAEAFRKCFGISPKEYRENSRK